MRQLCRMAGVWQATRFQDLEKRAEKEAKRRKKDAETRGRGDTETEAVASRAGPHRRHGRSTWSVTAAPPAASLSVMES